MTPSVPLVERPRRARFMRLFNVPMRFILGLPFSTPLSGALMLLSFTGRKSGKAYRQPVSYVPHGVASRVLRSGASKTVVCQLDDDSGRHQPEWRPPTRKAGTHLGQSISVGVPVHLGRYVQRLRTTATVSAQYDSCLALREGVLVVPNGGRGTAEARGWAGRVLLGLWLSAGLLSWPPAAAAAQFDQGLQDGWAFDNQGNTAGPNLLAEQFGLMQQAGAGWVRLHFRLGECFSAWEAAGCRADGKTALQLSEEVVDLALAHHLKILGLLTHESWRGGGQALWNENNVEHGGTDGDNAYLRDLATRAAAPLAAQLRGKVDAWELWTKPNAWTDHAGTTYTGGTFIYPSNYAQLLKQVGAGIKTANPEATFISGGLLSHDVGAQHQGLQGTYAGRPADCPSTLPSGGEYLCAVYAMGRTKAGWTAGASPFDHLGQHLYIRQNTAVTSPELVAYLEDLRQVYLAYGGEPPTKQTQVTAFGWTSAPFARTPAFVSPELQAQNLETAYRTFRDLSPAQGGYVARAYWFRTRDADHPPSNPEYLDYFGLADPQGNPKPAFTAYQAYASY